MSTLPPAPSTPSVPRGLSPQLWHGLVQALPVPSGKSLSILDCGGGSGSLAVPLAVMGAEVTVVDVSIDALGTLVRRATESGVSDRVTAVQGEAEGLHSLLAAQAFDVVLAHEVLEDVSDVTMALAEIVGVLRPGGVVSIVVANPVAAVIGRALAGDLVGALSLIRQSESAEWDVPALTRRCEAAGLHVDQIDGIGVFSDLVPGIELERPGAQVALAELDQVAGTRAPYRDIAARLHIIARRAGPAAGA
ncbi:methyltransferase domain-containing protein [Jatrophihabitans telluris]|uniref:Methyltransferase domain-containing protein n=1 Tax=Jatrophihabitans telluris TaxID=2038343 RepID=A0ABY4QUV4_9ACTN|nr:methyltransferase domain-containing protein [Jatrophihabitans telluris]UQX87203.1 methyltransferase domain-containing protein [Jatrophihabitans telluris]